MYVFLIGNFEGLKWTKFKIFVILIYIQVKLIQLVQDKFIILYSYFLQKIILFLFVYYSIYFKILK